MKIAVIGAGAIGGLVAGYLKNQGEDVRLIGRRDAVEAIRQNGLCISGVRGELQVALDTAERLSERPELAILAVKSQDIDSVFRDNGEYLRDTFLLTSQNGVQADRIVACYVDKAQLISSIVMFGATYLEPGKVVHNFEGSWILGNFFGPAGDKIGEIAAILGKSFSAVISDQIAGMKYLKIFVNANNCIPAILGVSMQEAFSDQAISKISVAIWKEGLEVTRRSKIAMVSLPDFPLSRIEQLTALPLEEAGKIFSGIMRGLSQEPLYGSILQSIKRNRSSEVDYINGEFVRMAQAGDFPAPLNQKLVSLVHRVERERTFLPKDALLKEVSQFLPA